jgi:D-3-phosphoglycerate dehydrogenase
VIEVDRQALRVLAAGDNFVRADTLIAKMREHFAGQFVPVKMTLPWPQVPFGRVGEVDEASGTEEQLIEALTGVTVLLTQLAPVTERVLQASPDLRVVGVTRGGPVNVNIGAARTRGIEVFEAPGRNATATAEMTLGMILAVTRRIVSTHNTLVAHEWRGSLYDFDQVGCEIGGSTVGLVGFGQVGRLLAGYLESLGAKILVFDPYAGDLAGLAVQRVESIEDLFSLSDVVSVHARLTSETHGLVSGELLSLMPRGSFFVNSARGGLVDYDAVARAVKTGQLGGAAFDVFPTEPVDFGHPIIDLAERGYNIVLTPHIAGATTQTADRACNIIAASVAGWLHAQANSDS